MPAQFQDPESGSVTSEITPFDSLLVQCRDLVCERLSLALAAMLDKAEESLSALANETRDATVKKLYGRTRDKALAERETIEKQFRVRYLREFQQRSNRVKKIGDSFAAIDLSSLELELVGTEDLEESLKFNAMAARLRQYCDEELIALDQRVGVLLGDASLQTEDNPFTPQAICDAYKYTCRQLDSQVDVRLVLLRLFDDHVADEIRAIYKAVNALLVQNSILPKIRLSAKREAGKPPPALQPAVETPKVIAPAAMAHTPSAPAQTKAPDGEQDLFSILKNLRAASADATPQAGIGGVTGHAAGGGTAAQQTLLQGAELMGLLTRIQLGDATATPGTILPMAHAASGGMGMENVLRELKHTSVGTGMNQLDMMTLDIMSLVFDQLFDDPKIPVGVKGLIGRLQIPMLKVAIADKTFFSRKTHPARQLLDTLGDISLRLPADFNTSSPLFGKMEIILQELIDRFESSMEVFDVARKRVETLIAEEDQRVQKETESAASRIEQNEKLGLAKTVAQAEIRARARIANVPVRVLEFLIEQWVQVLLVIHVVDGEDSENWRTALETMDLLIWSVEPKQTVDERRELAVIVPEVLQRISAGLRKVEIDDAVRKAFFADLMAMHTGIIGKPDAPEQPVAHKTIDTIDIAADAQAPVEPVAEEVPPAVSAPSAGQAASVPDLQVAASAQQPEPVVAEPAQVAGAGAPVSSVADHAPALASEPAPQATAESALNTLLPAAPAPSVATPKMLPDLEFSPVPAVRQAPGAETAATADVPLAPVPERNSAAPSAAPPPAAPLAATPAAIPEMLMDLEFISVPTVQQAPAAHTSATTDAPLTLVPEPDSTAPAAAAPAPAHEPVSVPAGQSSVLPDLEFLVAPTPEAAPAAESKPSPEPVFRLDMDMPSLTVDVPAGPGIMSSPLPNLDLMVPPVQAEASAAAPTLPPKSTAPAPPDTSKPVTPLAPPPATKPAIAPIQPAKAAQNLKPGTAPAAQIPRAPAARPTGSPPSSATPAKPGVAQPAVAQRAVSPAGKSPPALPPAQGATRPAQPVRPGASPPVKPATSPPTRPVSPTATAARSGISPAAGRPAAAPPARPDSKAADALDFTASLTVQNPFGGGKVQVDDLDFTVKPAAGAAGPKVEAVPAELPAKLALGTWVGIREKDDKAARKSAKLSFISPLKTRYLFVDKQGKTALDCSRAELARRFRLNEIAIMDKEPDVPLFDRLTEGLVGKLGGNKPQR